MICKSEAAGYYSCALSFNDASHLCVALKTVIAASIYLFKFNNGNTRKNYVLFSRTPERSHWRRSAVFIVNFEQIVYTALIRTLLSLSK